MVAERTAERATGLKGAEVAVTGRLASMSHDEAQERIVAAGGGFVEHPGARTSYLVVGQGGPPLGEDGRLTRSLREAHALRDRGHALEIVGEERFLELLGLEDKRANLHRLYTTQQLARILDLPRHELRKWIRLQLIRPVKVVRRLRFFDFRQVATARHLAQLTQSGVTPARLRKSLRRLSTWLPDSEHALAQLEALEDGAEVALRTEDGLLAEPSGQLRLAFDERTDTAARRPAREEAGELSWFDRAILLEEAGRPEDAIVAYERALAVEGARPEILFNLGNALYAGEQYGEAARAFERATRLDPEFVEAWNNLGNALGRLERTEDAVAAFERALALEPDYADAHFNLAETLAAAGDVGAARRHWRAYLTEDPGSAWADVVRERLTLLP